jgi:hypothetical protein
MLLDPVSHRLLSVFLHGVHKINVLVGNGYCQFILL